VGTTSIQIEDGEELIKIHVHLSIASGREDAADVPAHRVR
jgi:hypothetical protein